MIASWLTVDRMSSRSAARPRSFFGRLEFGSGRISHLEDLSPNVLAATVLITTSTSSSQLSLLDRVLLVHSTLRDEKVVLIDVDLDAGDTSVELEERQRAVLRVVDGFQESNA